MIVSIILIYLILLCLLSYVKVKKHIELIVYNNGQLLFQIFIIISFFFIYIFMLRILNLFRVNQILDLNNYDINQNIIIAFFLFYSFRKLVIYFFKVSWFKFHYVMMCENNFSSSIHKKYKFFFYNFIYSPAFFTFKYLIYVNYTMFLILLLVFSYDILMNNLILNYSLYFLKYYSIFKIFFISYKFMATKQNLILDYYSYNLMYPGNVENNFFIKYSDFQHYFLMQESEKYVIGIILEKNDYFPRYLGNTLEMPFFKKLIR